MEILLNPGPVNLSDRVRRALLRPDLCHREIEFTQLQRRIRQGLLDVYGLTDEAWAAVLITGSGTAAMEAMLISLLPANARVLIIENGVYGERLSRIAEIYGIPYQTLHYDWGDAIKPGDVAAALANGATHVALIHHETTTGRLNDLDRIAGVCKPAGIPILLDGVSSFGAEAIEFDRWNLLACAATANKCLHGVPGTSFVLCRRDAVRAAASVKRSLYLDLHTYLIQQDGGGTPFTQSVQSFYALDEALCEHRDEGGWTRRRELYRERMRQIRTGLEKLGITALLPAESCSCVLHAFHLPRQTDYQTLHDGLKRRGFVIYAGQGGLVKSIFRVAVMGAITADDVQSFLRAVAEILGG
jgi:2-aminoethylphosphonate-pyruvate transaminase